MKFRLGRDLHLVGRSRGHRRVGALVEQWQWRKRRVAALECRARGRLTDAPAVPGRCQRAAYRMLGAGRVGSLGFARRVLAVVVRVMVVVVALAVAAPRG